MISLLTHICITQLHRLKSREINKQIDMESDGYLVGHCACSTFTFQSRTYTGIAHFTWWPLSGLPSWYPLSLSSNYNARSSNPYISPTRGRLPKELQCVVLFQIYSFGVKKTSTRLVVHVALPDTIKFISKHNTTIK